MATESSSTTEIYEKYKTSSSGLTNKDVRERLLIHGRNTLAIQKKSAVIIEYLSKFFSPMTLILICASVISGVIGEYIDATIIVIIVFFSCTLEFIQEHAAQKALEKLRSQVATTTSVIREGRRQEVAVDNITIGDVVTLSCGDIIPADCVIIEADDFFVNESAITGESFPVEKSPTSREEKLKKLFMGTTVISGSAKAVVTSIGTATEFGKVSLSLSKQAPKSEYEHGVLSFGYYILKLSIFLVLFIFIINSLKRGSIIEALLFAVAIAVGVIPELLPMIMTITMAMGAQKMARKGVMVKQLSSIPNFGSMDILCTDKTGTLTENKIALVKHVGINGKTEEDVLLATYLISFYQTGIKNPMDDAVLAFRHPKVSEFEKLDEAPYDFDRKRMSVLVKTKRKTQMFCKGAPEEVFSVCTKVLQNKKLEIFTPRMKTQTKKIYDDLSCQGYRVLAVATRNINALHITGKDENNMTLLGFVAFLDPAKKDVIEVITSLKELGVDVKIITGDNELVTKKICSDIGISCKNIVLGHELEHINDEALKIKAKETTIFARCSPVQKNRIIRALKAAGHVVGYMGDGINDAPSLKSADVGISVNNAVDIAKESAQIVLTKKSLSNLRDGVIEGRKTFANSIKYIMMACSSNFGNMFSATAAILYLPFLPMLPLQIILNNFIYDFSQITIPTDNVDEDWIKKPRKWNLKFIKKFMLVFGPISSLFDILLFVLLFTFMHVGASTLQTAWFMFSLATQTFGILIIRTKVTPFFKSWPSFPLLISGFICFIAGWILPYTPIGEFFKFVELPPAVIFVIIGVQIAYLMTLELTKKWFYARYEY